jgi:hypothetical protein
LIENLQILKWLNDKDRDIFFRKIPNLAVTTGSSFTSKTIRKREMLLRVEVTVLSSDSENEKPDNFEPPSDTEVEESEEEPFGPPIPVILEDNSTEFPAPGDDEKEKRQRIFR